MFLPIKSDNGAVLPFEYLPAAAGAYKAGQVLNVDGGKVIAVSAAMTTTPPYLCMAETTVEDGAIIPVTRISKDNIYETTLSAEAAGADIGTKLQISAGGLEADATATGTFEVVSLEGTEQGATVRGRWL